jgi:hypothetical protein
MNKDTKQLLEATLAALNRRISKLKKIGDFLGAENLEEFKKEYFIANTDAVTKWKQRTLNDDP